MTNPAINGNPVWIEISQLSQPRARWIWWAIEGEPDAPQEGSRTFTSFRDLKENLETRGYQAPTATDIDRLTIEARADGLDVAKMKVLHKGKG